MVLAIKHNGSLNIYTLHHLTYRKRNHMREIGLHRKRRIHIEALDYLKSDLRLTVELIFSGSCDDRSPVLRSRVLGDLESQLAAISLDTRNPRLGAFLVLH